MNVVPVRVPQVDLDDVERRNLDPPVALVHGLQFRLELGAARSRERKMFELQFGPLRIPRTSVYQPIMKSSWVVRRLTWSSLPICIAIIRYCCRPSKSFEHDLAARGTTFNLCMYSAQSGGIDLAGNFGNR